MSQEDKQCVSGISASVKNCSGQMRVLDSTDLKLVLVCLGGVGIGWALLWEGIVLFVSINKKEYSSTGFWHQGEGDAGSQVRKARISLSCY